MAAKLRLGCCPEGQCIDQGPLLARIEQLEAALNLICSLEQPIGRSDSNLLVAQRIADGALANSSISTSEPNP